MLRAVDTVPDPWDRRTDETENDYLAFLMWLHSEPRGTPKATHLASRHDWSARARAHDTAVRISGTPKDDAKVTAATIVKLARVLAEKMLNNERTIETLGISPRDAILVINLAQKGEINSLINVPEDQDFSDLSTEQLRVMRDAKKILSARSR